MKNTKLNFKFSLAMLVAGMIGSAIFSLSGLTISKAGPASILSWIIAAIIQFCYGVCMAELATLYKKSGGIFVFPERTFENEKGKFLGFISTWGNYFTDVVAITFASMYVGIYLSVSFPALANYQIVFSIATIIICYTINCLNLSFTGKVNFLLGTVLAILLIVYSFTTIASTEFSLANMTPFFTQGNENTLGFLKVVPIAMIGYSSVVSISFMADEIDNPKKNIPIATMIAVGIVMCIYALVIFATIGTITSNILNETGMVYIPLFAVASIKLEHIPYLDLIISVAAVIALLSTNLVVIAMNGRYVKAVADKGVLPNIFTKTVNGSVPIVCMTLTCIFSIILCFYDSLIDKLINLGALFAIITIMINFISLLVSRKKYKNSNENYFKAPISNIFVIIIFAIIILCYIPDIIEGKIDIWIVTILWFLLGIIVYFLRKKIINK